MRDDFDWVTARAKCTAFEVFKQLQAAIENDVKIRSALLREGDQVRFTKREEPTAREDSLSIIRLGPGQASIEFSCSENTISVKDGNGKLKFEATLTLNDEGECCLKVGELELRSWQFRKRALEEFFRF